MDTSLWYQKALDARTSLPAPPDPDKPYPDDYLAQLEIALDGLVLPRELADQTGQAMRRIVRRNAHRPPGSQTIIAISAPFGAGKSTFATRWGYERHLELLGHKAGQQRPEWQPEPGVIADLVPVVYVTVPSDAVVKSFNAQLLTFMGYEPEGVTRVTTTLLVNALKKHRVRIIILDDVHLMSRGEKTARKVLDHLKFLNTELGGLNGTLVLVGANLQSSDIVHDPQIKTRLRTFTLDPFAPTDRRSARAWQTFLQGAESILLPQIPWIEPGTFSSVYAKLIWQRTQGFAGDVTQLLGDVVLEVATHHLHQITADTLDAVTLSDRAMEAEAMIRFDQ